MNNFNEGTDGDWNVITNPYSGTLTSTNIFCPGYIAANVIKIPGGKAYQYLMADGSTSTTSGGSNGSNIYVYTNSTNTVSIPPSGVIRYNSIHQAAATELYVSYQTKSTLDIDAFLNMINETSLIYLQIMTIVKTSLNILCLV